MGWEGFDDHDEDYWDQLKASGTGLWNVKYYLKLLMIFYGIDGCSGFPRCRYVKNAQLLETRNYTVC